jgi:hypothetical protein
MPLFIHVLQLVYGHEVHVLTLDIFAIYVDWGHALMHVPEERYFSSDVLSHDVHVDVVVWHVLHCVSHLHPKLLAVSFTVPIGHWSVQLLNVVIEKSWMYPVEQEIQFLAVETHPEQLTSHD